MRKAAKVCKIPLGQFKIMAAFNHGSNNLGDGLDLIKVFSNFGIGFSDMTFIIGPGCHIVSPLSGDPIVAFGFSFLNFAAGSFLCFLSELMKKHVGLIFVVEVQYPVVSWTKLPDVFFQMLGDVFAEQGTVILKQLYYWEICLC